MNSPDSTKPPGPDTRKLLGSSHATVSAPDVTGIVSARAEVDAEMLNKRPAETRMGNRNAMAPSWRKVPAIRRPSAMRVASAQPYNVSWEHQNFRTLLASQGDHRVDAAGAPRRQVSRERRYRQQQQNRRACREGIAGSDAKQ